MIAREDLSQANAGVYGMCILGPAGHAEASAGPYAKVPRLTVERFGGLSRSQGSGQDKTKKKSTTETRRHGEQRMSELSNVHELLLGISERVSGQIRNAKSGPCINKIAFRPSNVRYFFVDWRSR
jgi:hypothetical protein